MVYRSNTTERVDQRRKDESKKPVVPLERVIFRSAYGDVERRSLHSLLLERQATQ